MEGPEGQSEGGAERPGSSQVPPIAATPPRRGWKEELVSRSSSGTHVSNASGISLGEVIKLQSTINRDMSAWYQPYAEIGTSNLLGAIGRRLGQTSGASGLAEFPIMEGGPISPADESGRQHASDLTHTALLDVRDSRLSPNLPLLTTYSTQGRTFFNETLFQSSGMDFAPLRGTPDASDAAHETSRPLQMSEAVLVAAQDLGSDVDSFSLSQHPFTLSPVPPGNISPGSCLSEYPLSFSRQVPMEQGFDSGEQLPHFAVGTSALVPEDGNSQFLRMQKLLNQPLAKSLPPEGPQGTISSPDLFLLDNTVPAPLLLEMLEKEVGLSKHGGFLSSSESSSCKSALGKNPEENEASWLAENLIPGQREPEAFAGPCRQDGRAVPEFDSSQHFSDPEGKPFKNAGLSERLPGKTLQVALTNRGHGLSDSLLPRPLLDQQWHQQVPEGEEPKQERAAAMAYSRHETPVPFQLVSVSAKLGDVCSKQVDSAALGTQTGVNKRDLTLSGRSIEREHKYTGISPSFTEASFFGHLVHPINHSTPGVVPARALMEKDPGWAPPVQSGVQPSPSSFHAESLTHSHASTCVPSVEKPRGPSVDDTLLSYAEEPPTLRSEQEVKTGNSESLQALHPLKGRIQSLPSLNFMEKVGVWNTSQSAEKMSDALALQSLSGVSPRQKAYSAIADSLNHILSKQVELQEGLAASVSASSMASLRTLDKKPLCAFPLTRSRSENSVIAISQEVLRADARKEIEQEEDFRPAEDGDAVLGAPAMKWNDARAEDPPGQHYTAVLVSTVLSDEDTVESVSGERDLNRFITSERVAELLQEDAVSLSGDQEKTDSCWGYTRTPPGAHLTTSQLSMDHFSDVSPDSLSQINSSVASSCVNVRLSPRQASALSRESRNSFEDVSTCPSSVLKTPEDSEINIEERIPVYLRNLGIDQSPSSILTPFLPRGPIREIEFSPSELRTMKASTDALRQRFQESEGDSHSMVDATQSSFDSSAVSVPILTGSDTGPDTSLPTDLLPKSSRDLLSLGGVECSLGEPHAPTPRPPESIFEIPAAPQLAEYGQGIPAVPARLLSAEETSTRCVQVLEDRFNRQELGVSQEIMSPSSLAEEEKGEPSAHREPYSLRIILSEEEDRDSFIGSKTLKEIQDLLVEAEARSPSRFNPISSVSSALDLGGSLTRATEAGGCGDFVSAPGSSPVFQRMWSWDETLSRQNVHEDIGLSKTLSFTGSLKWEGALSGGVLSNEPLVPEEPRAVSHEEAPMKSTERSEPEGCNSAMGDRALPLQPVLLKSATGRDFGAVRELPPATAAEPSGSIEDILEGFQQILDKVGEAGSKGTVGTGSIYGSENSSSVDSLGIRVKNILRGEYPVTHAKQWTEGEDRDGHRKKPAFVDPSLAFSRENASVQESGNSSSLDSLAARVKTLLEDEHPAMHVAEILQRAEEGERKAHVWGKLKLAAESANSVFDLNEEDRRKVEEIKNVLVLSARKAEIQDQLCGNSYAGVSSPIQKPETGCSVVPNDAELQKDIQTHNLHIAEFPDKVRHACGTDHTLPRDLEVKPSNSVQSYICTQLQACSDKPVDSSTSFHAHGGPDRGTCLSVQRGASEAHAGEERSISPTEAAKQITSITFASRKRSPPLPSSPVPSAGLLEAVPRDLVPSEAKSIGGEQPGPSRRVLDAFNPCTSVSSTATYLRDNTGFSPDRDGQPVSLIVSRDESPQGRGPELEENSQTRCIEVKVHFVTEDREEAVAASQVFTGLRGNERLFSGGHDEKVDPGGKTADWLLSINPPQQTTENYYPQDQFAGSFGSFVRDSSWSGDTDARNPVLLPASFPDHVSTVMMAPPSSPTRKALSGVHITLSPKRADLDLLSPAAAEAELGQSDVSKTGPHPATSSTPGLFLETTSKFKPSELYPKTQDSADFPRPASTLGPYFGQLHSTGAANASLRRSQELSESRLNRSGSDQENASTLGSAGQNREGNFKITVSSQTERLSSDAITQITTESPEKTTYSAEIFVSTGDGESDAVRSPRGKGHDVLRAAPPALDQVSILDRQAGKPLLLPYKPPGSSEMYYVPCPKETLRLSRVRSETTMESSHSGSNDAVPPEFPRHALGLGDESQQNAAVTKHKEGIYSKRAVPKVAWAEGKPAAQERAQESAKNRSSLESVQATHSVFGSAQFYLHQPVPGQHELDSLARSEALEQSAETGRLAPPSRDFFQYEGMLERSQPPFSLHQPAGEQRFTPLIAEPDDSLLQELSVTEACERDFSRKDTQPNARKAGHQVAKELPLPGSQTSRLKDHKMADLPQMQRVHFTSSLDELWSKYLERQQQQQQQDPARNKNELSLVERLDRLARLLQNPVRHSLMPAADEQGDVQEKERRREPKKVRSPGKTQGKKSYLVPQAEESHDATSSSQLSKSRRQISGYTKAAGPLRRILEQSLNSETPSDTSSDIRPSKDSSTLTDLSTSESDAVTQEETAPPTEASGSVSSIDTARLVRAFGHGRVCVSPKLSQLYSTISLQKTRSDKRAKGSRRALGMDPQKMVRPEHKRKGAQATYPISSSDSVSTPGSNRGPSFALSNKRTTRMLNKAVQAGDFEIMNSATKKHTRDVGLTFPTPPSSQMKLQGDRWNVTEDEPTWPDGLFSGSKGRAKRQPSGLLTEKRPARHKPKLLQGISWYVPAEDLKSDPQKEARSDADPDPAPSWFEPLSGAKPWREPLHEKNWPEDPSGLQVRLTAPARDVENEPPPPCVKLSVQEALVLRRPDFISRSGERVKRLKLIMEERKLQSMLQSEREQLFNPPEERRAYRKGLGLVSNRGYRAIQRARSVSKSEMVQRSKRIYEQLPEVRKRREEEKRKSDYSTYRLKAQLYKMKITNRILGRKVPWE